ncbi:MAG: transposase [Candidatus Poribacteria bacterium]|nr:transposase [Candidatus Poribacteria bacterium]
MVRPTRLDYCQYLLSTPINYTLTHFAKHSQRFSHDQINWYLANEQLRPRHVWEHVRSHLEQTSNGFLIFDDTVLDKRYAKEIALAKHQYSGNAGKTINGIGIVTCVYVNPALDRYWLIDYRIYDKRGDGKSKLDHVQDMLWVMVYSRTEITYAKNTHCVSPKVSINLSFFNKQAV